MHRNDETKFVQITDTNIEASRPNLLRESRQPELYQVRTIHTHPKNDDSPCTFGICSVILLMMIASSTCIFITIFFAPQLARSLCAGV